MNSSKAWKIALLVIVTLCGLVSTAPSVRAQSTPHLTVIESGQSLVAGLNNNVSITVVNNYSGYIAIYDVGLTVSLPSGLSLVGSGGTWQFNSINYGQGVTVSFQVYAPSSAAGSSYAGTLTITYKQLGDISYTSETHSLTFGVTGYINLVVYGVLLSPSAITAGGNTTVSGEVLNDGNLSCYNANVTVTSPAIIPGSQNSVFLGEIDPTIPRPFSVLIVFKPGIAPGNYTINISVSAMDYNRPASPLIGQGTAVVQVLQQIAQPVRAPPSLTAAEMIVAFFRSLFNAFFGSSSG